MSRTIEDMFASIKAQRRVGCPYCNKALDLTDGERMQGHVTYWGEERPQPISCWGCDATFYLKENVTRDWTAGRTPEEADDR